MVVKIGSNVLTQNDGLPDIARIKSITSQIAMLRDKGIEVILISSGAVASGRSLINVPEKTDAIAARQLLAAVGQVKLINSYSSAFHEHDMVCAQVLVTKEDFRDRKHYLNMKNCFHALLQNKVVPIVNENDVVSVTELMFTDNDELAGLVAAMLNADALVILSNVDGVFNGDPRKEGAQLIEEIRSRETDFASFVSPGKSQFGRGGMVTKSVMAQKVARLGIPVHIANGKRDNVLPDLLNAKLAHSKFVPDKNASGTKKWLANSADAATGKVQVNEGAKAVLLSDKAASLLPVGVTAILSDFKKGDIIRIVDDSKQLIGLGIAQYGSDKAKERIGEHNQKALIHYDYFYPCI
jgi:glutamate 5-kinase